MFRWNLQVPYRLSAQLPTVIATHCAAVMTLPPLPCVHTCTWFDTCAACRTKALHSALAAMDPPPHDVKIVKGAVDNYQQLLLTSTFCLAPYGHGWGLRLVQAVQHGCVPVVVQDSVYQPYEVRQYGCAVTRAHTPPMAMTLFCSSRVAASCPCASPRGWCLFEV